MESELTLNKYHQGMPPFAMYAYPGRNEELTFRTYLAYLEAARLSIESLCPHASGLLPGVAAAVKAAPWIGTTATGARLSVRAGQYLRNA
jgi:hypothetical protein